MSRAAPSRRRTQSAALVAAACALGLLIAAAAAGGARQVDGNWLAWGRTADQMRFSPLTQITPANVDQLGRAFTVDFRQIDPTVRRGEQSFPLARNGVLYLTTNDDNVWAVDGTSGKILWRFTPSNVAVFRNFGIVANRGVAWCDGRLFLLTLDMHIDMLSPSTGRLLRRVPIASAVPGASSNYGYSETSAPMCAKHVLVVGAAGSEYGIRGFVMGFRTRDLGPAWPSPYWTVPPEQQAWRRAGRLVGGGAVWTPTTLDAKTNTLFFGTGSATPLYYPSLRPGRNPRTDSLIALNLQTGQQKWWQQQMSHNEWSYDTAQPPLVYDAKIGGHTRRIVSVGTMEGVWFAYDAKTGAPIYQRVKVIDRTEHPALRPGQPVVVYPSSLGGLNFSPASFDPKTHYVYNAAAETAAVMQQATLTPAQRARKLVGDVFLGLENGNFGTVLQGWHDHGSISAIDVATGRRVWKFNTPEPERGGVTTTASGVGFSGGGDGKLRAFDVRTGKLLWSFQTGHQIAGGSTLYAVGGKEYLAITSGGTPTSSGGGTASELQVFTLGASQKESPAPQLPSFFRATPADASPAIVQTPPAERAPAAARKKSRGGGVIAAPRVFVRGWNPSSSNEFPVTGRVLLGGRAVAGVRLRVDGYNLPRATDAAGRFRALVDMTVARRHVVTVSGAGSARIGGRPLSAGGRSALRATNGGITVAYRLSGLSARKQKDGTVLVTGRASYGRGGSPPKVVLYTYQLRGTVKDAGGKPVEGAVVVTRTNDRDFWTFSQPTNAQGDYVSFFTAADESNDNPVPLAVQVAVGADTYGLPTGVQAKFDRLKSSVMNITLPARVGAPQIQQPTSYTGAVYEGLIVGVSGPGGVVKPIAARWPDRSGRFSLVLPRSVRGHRLSFWQNQKTFFSQRTARPGGLVDLSAWPAGLLPRVPQNVAVLRMPR